MPNWEDRQTEKEIRDSLESITMARKSPEFYEFFAGGGMARLGLGPHWNCTFANEWCEKKASTYRSCFGRSPELQVKDVRSLVLGDLPGQPDLVWASFPCQDLSLAGNGAGLKGERSGTFWSFWRLMEGLAREGRPSPLIVLENVVGALTSRDGGDFRAIVESVTNTGYRVGALVIDAIHFVPQSRPRLFILAIDAKTKMPSGLRTGYPSMLWHPTALKAAHAKLSAALRESWVWWHLPPPRIRRATLDDIIESRPASVEWHTPDETRRLLRLMSRANLRKVEQASRLGKPVIGTVYRRTRLNENGEKVQRAEVRFDQVSGCLRTPAGGSSRQTILVVDGDMIQSRLLSPREAARLMGVPDSYALPENYNEGYHLMGDGLVVPVVSWLENQLLHPLRILNRRTSKAA